MRHVRMLGLCLVAALALGAYAVSSASALEWGKCEFVGSGGNFTGPNCSKAAGEKAKPKGSGTYEWRKASEVAVKREAEGKSANVAFSGESVGTGGVLNTGAMWCEYPVTGTGPDFQHRVTRAACIASEGEDGHGFIQYKPEEGISVECQQEINTGETEGKNKVANVHVTFKGCVLGGSVPCKSEGAEEEEVVINTLKGKLGWLSKASKEVGVMLEPAAHHKAFAEFECGGFIHVKVGVGNKKEGSFYLTSGCVGKCESATPEEEKHGGYDEIISPITPVNTMTSEFTQVFKINSLHQNVPSNFEGKHISLLEDTQQLGEPTEDGGNMWSPAGEELTNVNTPEEEGEIKA